MVSKTKKSRTDLTYKETTASETCRLAKWFHETWFPDLRISGICLLYTHVEWGGAGGGEGASQSENAAVWVEVEVVLIFVVSLQTVSHSVLLQTHTEGGVSTGSFKLMVIWTHCKAVQWSLRFKTPLFNNSLHFKAGYWWHHLYIFSINIPLF